MILKLHCPVLSLSALTLLFSHVNFESVVFDLKKIFLNFEDVHKWSAYSTNMSLVALLARAATGRCTVREIGQERTTFIYSDFFNESRESGRTVAIKKFIEDDQATLKIAQREVKKTR